MDLSALKSEAMTSKDKILSREDLDDEEADHVTMYETKAQKQDK